MMGPVSQSFLQLIRAGMITSAAVGATPACKVVALKAHARKVEAANACSVTAPMTIADIQAELHAEMLKACRGQLGFVTGTVLRQANLKPRECLHSTDHAIASTLDHLSVMRILREVLATCDHPKVDELRKAMADGYAQMNSADVAEARGIA